MKPVSKLNNDPSTVFDLPHDFNVQLLADLPAGSRIVIVRLRSIGDIILLTPALRMLKQWRPDLHTSVVVEDRFKDLLAANRNIDEWLSPGCGRGALKAWRRINALRRLRAGRFDLCLNLHGGPASSMLAQYSGARWKAGFYHFRRQGIYNFSIPDARLILGQERVHTAEHQAAAFFYLGMPHGPIPAADLYVTAAAIERWAQHRARLGLAEDEPYAIIHPTATYPTKRWAAEGFAEAGARLQKQFGLQAIYTCGPGERATLDLVQKAAGEAVKRAEDLSLAEFAAALRGARIVIGNDSGPAHMAAALRRPLVVIFGSSSSTIWGPWQGNPREAQCPPALVVQNTYDCNPCPGDHCYRFAQPECILSIRLEQVWQAVEEAMRFGSDDSAARV